ncbi:MAG: D-alanyl-D-alanine carboxypeptidase family protein [Oscillospiraceae bacterium]
MKKRILCILSVILTVFSVSAFPVSGNALSISAKAGVLLDVQTGKILFEQSSREILPMASTTKVMTALLTLEYIEIFGDKTVIVTDEMCKVEGSSMGLKTGDQIQLSDLAVGMLLPSGNDAANAAALYISKSFKRFADCMNLKAQEIGMTDTHFVTPSGLDDPEHYTTAYDMAILTAAALENEKFAEIFSAKTVEIHYNGGKTPASFSNHNKLLGLYENCIGGKTGFTKKSGRCLVSAAKKNGCTLVAVTLNAPDDWNDHISLYQYGFFGLKTTSFKECMIKIPDTEGKNLMVRIPPIEKSHLFGHEIKRQIFLPKFIYAGAYGKGEVIGKMIYSLQGRIIETVEIQY